jgi:hypothetical protein
VGAHGPPGEGTLLLKRRVGLLGSSGRFPNGGIKLRSCSGSSALVLFAQLALQIMLST